LSAHKFGLFPFDGCGRFGADVVANAIDPTHFIDDACGDTSKKVVGESAPVGGHEIVGIDASHGSYIFIRTSVPHHPYALGFEKDDEGLGGLSVEVCISDFIDEDFIGFAKHIELCSRYFTEAADGKSRTWEGVTPDEVVGQSEFDAKLSDFVFE
jgi:hypothetical protein